MPVHTHCPYCALQCGTELSVDAASAVAVRPSDFDVNRGGLCQKGWTAPTVLRAPDRLLEPQLRDRDGRLVAVDWDTALDEVARRLRRLREESGPQSVGVFGGGALTNEKAYLLGKFARLALATDHFDYNGRFCMSSAAEAGTAAFGIDRGLPFPVSDLRDADAVLVAGGNPAATMPPLMQHLDPAALVVADPRRTTTAERAALHLQPTPGTDLALALGLLHVAVVEGLLDKAYIAERTTGFDDAWGRALTWSPGRVEEVTGVPAADLHRTVEHLATATHAYVLTGRGVEQHSKGSDTAAAFVNLALALGLPGRPGSGYGTITGQGNGQGGREHGQKSDQLPGYRSIDDPAARAHVAAVWGVDPAALGGRGRRGVELFDSLGTPGGLRGLLVLGSNPVVSAPDAGRVAARLAAADLLVVADTVPSETAALADVVLPVTQWAEEEGTTTNLEGRVLRRHRAVDPPPGVRSDLWVLAELAERLGQPAARFPREPAAVLDELARASAGGPADYSGVSHARLDTVEALYWPCPADSTGTPRPFLDRFAHPDGRARFATVEHRAPAETVDAERPLWGTTGRLLAQYQSGAQTRRVPELVAAAGEPAVEVHPDTARRAGLVDGGLARVSSARGATVMRVRTHTAIRDDTVFLPFHFAGDARANLVTHGAVDPRSGMPEFKVAAVRLDPVAEAEAHDA